MSAYWRHRCGRRHRSWSGTRLGAGLGAEALRQGIRTTAERRGQFFFPHAAQLICFAEPHVFAVSHKGLQSRYDGLGHRRAADDSGLQLHSQRDQRGARR